MNNELNKKIERGCLLTAGSIEDFNTMTIGWGMIGTLWGKECFMVFVRPSRYTFKYLEENDYFTVSFYDDKYYKAINYLGVKSGRNENKVVAVNFHPEKISESVTFKEAEQTFVCKKIYFQDMVDKVIPEDILKKYYPNKDIHRFYIGEIVCEIKKEK